jgi:hypothetical protein
MSDFSHFVSSGNGPCDIGLNYPARALLNASVDNSPGNLVSTANIMVDGDSDGLVNGIENYPSFLNAYLDPQRLTGLTTMAMASSTRTAPTAPITTATRRSTRTPRAPRWSRTPATSEATARPPTSRY